MIHRKGDSNGTFAENLADAVSSPGKRWSAWLGVFGLVVLFLSWVGCGISHSSEGEASVRKADFRTPYGAVLSFLAALKAKDPLLLQEATSLRAPMEAKAENKPLFTAILEQTLTEAKLTELATEFEGFQIILPIGPSKLPRSVPLTKDSPDGAEFVLFITTRREKSGWKVVDFDKPRKRPKPYRRKPKIKSSNIMFEQNIVRIKSD